MEESISTPDLSCIRSHDRETVYEPAEDTFLLLDALQKDGQLIRDSMYVGSWRWYHCTMSSNHTSIITVLHTLLHTYYNTIQYYIHLLLLLSIIPTIHIIIILPLNTFLYYWKTTISIAGIILSLCGLFGLFWWTIWTIRIGRWTIWLTIWTILDYFRLTYLA